jgi:hypothetical protein
MRVPAKRLLSLLAIYAVALQAVFGGIVMPLAQASAADPFTVICHSAANSDDGAAGSSQGNPQDKPSPCCDHCVLCKAAPVADNAATSSAIARRIVSTAVLTSAATAQPPAPPSPLRYLPRGPPPSA